MASAPLATQSVVQLALFFTLPFYLRAAAWTLGHTVFLGAMAAAALLTLWDPAFAWVFRHRPGRLAMVAFASFAGLACVLPVLGLSNQVSLTLAAVTTAVGVPVLDVLESPEGEAAEWPRRARRWLARGVVAAGVVAAAWGLGGPLVPPAAPIAGRGGGGDPRGGALGLGPHRAFRGGAAPDHLRHRDPGTARSARRVAS
ncbi:MAG: hypothetical protein H6730_21545 [Deltaproteobacteria bacterium]|nr:hypothetical protein [Deltaproteobacteria bacterium]